MSDLHVSHPANREVVEGLSPTSPDDWLIVAGDVAEHVGEVLETLAGLRRRFGTVLWVPGNHELWTHGADPVRLRGEHRYRYLVEACRDQGVLTPEDEFPVWEGPGGPIVVAPLFVGYDYTFRTPTAHTVEESLAQAHDAGIVCTDEHMLHPDPYPSRQAWCAARVAESERRLGAIDPALPTVLVNHYPLVRQPTDVLWYPEFAQWCGTTATADWHRRYRAEVVVYGHLHIPRTSWHDGVRFEEASLGYPREWRRERHPFRVPVEVLPGPGPEPDGGAGPWPTAATT